MACSGQAGSRVQIFLRPWALLATGVLSGLALVPTAAGTLSLTDTAPWPTRRPPTSRAAATIQLPASGSSTSAP
jgi:hypothetical protein